MHFAQALIAAFAGLAIAHPTGLEKRQSLPPVLSANDETVLQLALYLEHLEFNLYSGGINNFNEQQYEAEGFPPGFRDNVALIAQHEGTHIQTITAILEKAGKTPVPSCTYTFPYDSPTSFVDLANMVTSTGIGAFLGAGELLQDNDALLTAATSILTVESRHDAFLRAGVKGSPFPTAFDTALTAVFAYNIAQMFIVECPQQLSFPILPKLTLESPAPEPDLMPPVAAGTTLKFSFDPSKFFVAVDPNAPLYIGIINSITNVTYEKVTSCGTGCATVPVPKGAAGVAFAILTTFDDKAALTEDQLAQFGALAGPAEIVLS
ncbi:uncharacterized protein KY384_001708 [Bacidia gigantensis]|uniref:uncharacterized protein n=1 Tax=Bacidia gigantensis TaxID=2732470 RepID=UPI001D04B82D|nr:uncharacterized protein KY384_001708 [Bacidia gigantensis]KAG8533965.1 hypothetical protein KY384_001708 [Bacidia gigantensis]